MKYNSPLDNVGNTPVVRIADNDLENIELYAKLEFQNPTGSMKDRAASYILKKILHDEIINRATTIVESSSGNFGIALAAYCKKEGLDFCCVIDPNITPANETIIRSLGAHVIKVTEPDEHGGYLQTRIGQVKELVNSIPNSYWVNQYANPYNAEAYYYSLGNEIAEDFEKIDYVFIAVSSGGTITGVSRKIKEEHPNAKIIAVDIEGSVIFGGKPRKRHIPGIGSSIHPAILANAFIDDVVITDEVSSIRECHSLLKQHAIFAGGSSGTVFAAIKQYFRGKTLNERPVVITVFPDRGDRYSDTIYNEEWYTKVINANQRQYAIS